MDSPETRVDPAIGKPVQLASLIYFLFGKFAQLPLHMRKYTMISLFALIQELHFSVYKILDLFSLMRAVYHLIYSIL